MQAATGIDARGAGAVPRLLPEVRDEDARRRHLVAAAGALLFHAAALALIATIPAAPIALRPAPQVLVDVRRSTPLVAPPLPFRLTQKEPQRGRPAAEVDISALLPRPAVQQPGVRDLPRPFQPPPGTPQARSGRELDLDVPPVDVAQALPPAPTAGSSVPEPPRPAPPKRDNPFEPVGGPQSSPAQPRLALPPAGVAETVKSLARGGGGAGLTVGDVPHLAALCAPRPLVIFGGLTGRSLDLLGENSLRQTFSFTQAVYQAHRKPESLTIAYSLAWKDLIARL
jgi:hypothetical protein